MTIFARASAIMAALFFIFTGFAAHSASAAESIEALASPHVYRFPVVKWQGKDLNDGIPMMCDDSHFDAVLIPVPGTRGESFEIQVEGESCRITSERLIRTRGVTELLIENSENCRITVTELRQGARGNQAVYQLSDGC